MENTTGEKVKNAKFQEFICNNNDDEAKSGFISFMRERID